MPHSDPAEDAPPAKPKYPLPSSGDWSPPAGRVPKRSAQTERDQFISDIVQMVMEVFPGARWTTREEYQRAAAQRDRQRRKYRG